MVLHCFFTLGIVLRINIRNSFALISIMLEFMHYVLNFRDKHRKRKVEYHYNKHCKTKRKKERTK